MLESSRATPPRGLPPLRPRHAVRRTFLAAHAGVAAVALGLAGLALLRLHRVTSEVHAVRERTLEAVLIAEDAQDRFRLARTFARKAEVSGDPRYAERAAEDLARLRADLARLGTDEPALREPARVAADALHGGPGGAEEEAERALEELADAADALLSRRLGDAEAMGRDASGTLLMGSGLLLALLAATSALLSRTVTAPLRSLVGATRAYAAGDLSFRLALRRDDEFGRVAAAMNEMAERLDEARRREADLFHAVSHDLKTPLAAILEAGQLLREEVAGPLSPPQRTLVEIGCKEAERLRNLVHLLLEARKVASGIAPDLEEVDAREVIGSALRPLELRARGRGVRFREALAPSLPRLRLDRQRFEQVLVNLLDNAVRHAPPGSVVEIGAAPDGAGGALFWVEDEGPGIPPEERERVFEPFQKGRAGRRGRHDGGTGLGLAICRRIAEAHGGTVRVVEGLRGGARLEVLLPATVEASGRPAGAGAGGAGR